MGWHALLPPGSFVPPHIHPTQDEFIYMIEGKLDLQLGEQKSSAGPGDLIRLPMNEPPRSLQQRSGAGPLPVLGRPGAQAPRLVRQAAQPDRSGRGGAHLRRLRSQFPAAEILKHANRTGKIVAGEFPSKGSSHVRSSHVHDDNLRNGAIADQELAMGHPRSRRSRRNLSRGGLVRVCRGADLCLRGDPSAALGSRFCPGHFCHRLRARHVFLVAGEAAP